MIEKKNEVTSYWNSYCSNERHFSRGMLSIAKVYVDDNIQSI